MVFQSYALYPHMSVYDNISFGLRLRKMPKAEIDRRVRDAATKLGLTDLLDRKPKAMSGGQRQRVAMGRAIVRQPAVFLFDEPLSNLDAKLRVQMRAEIARMHRREGVTTIYVTHDQVEAMTLADRIVVMNLGVVQQVGAPLELYRDPANLFVAGFIGSPAMNFFDVEVSTRAGIPIITGRGLEVDVPARLRDHLGAATRLVLGVRPEHLTETHSNPHLTGRVDMLEPLGAEVHALGELDGQTLVASLDPDTRLRVGDPLPLRMDLDRIHLFDRATGLALGRRSQYPAAEAAP
jgi:multiple sugar transport system ATP-binding protein